MLWTLGTSFTTTATVPAAILNAITAVEVVHLSFYEHSRSVRPSTVLIIYLSLTCLFDLIQLRTLLLLDGYENLAVVEIAVISCKFALLLCEAHGKTLFLRANYQHLSPESSSGILNRSLLWWLNGIFAEDYRSPGSFWHTYTLDSDLTSHGVAESAQEKWKKRGTVIASRFRKRTDFASSSGRTICPHS